MNFDCFIHAFYYVFLILIAVGPGFLTIANIVMTKGYKTGFCAICGCLFGDCVYITLGAFCANKIVSLIPDKMLFVLNILAVIILLFLAYKFISLDIKSLKSKTFEKKNGISLALMLFMLKITSPISIAGYGIIFTQLIGVNDVLGALSAICGGVLASFVVNILMVLVFGTLGKKINIKVLFYINKICAIFIFIIAIKLIIYLIKSFI